MSKIQFGLALQEPSEQTLVPIMDTYGRMYGFFPITSTTFTGTETTYTLSGGPVDITTVTLPALIQNNSNISRVSQYMAAVYQPDQILAAPWRGYVEFVNSEIPNNVGYYSWWSMPSNGWFQHFGRGVFMDSLQFGMNDYVYTPPADPTPPVATPGTIEWACSINLQAFQENCSFIDFNWVDLFKTALQNNPHTAGQEIVPLAISTISNPPEGFFKASVVQAQGSQVIYPGGVAMFNTIRILRLQDPTAGNYVFTFKITDNLQQETTATLTLTVV